MNTKLRVLERTLHKNFSYFWDFWLICFSFVQI